MYVCKLQIPSEKSNYWDTVEPIELKFVYEYVL